MIMKIKDQNDHSISVCRHNFYDKFCKIFCIHFLSSFSQNVKRNWLNIKASVQTLNFLQLESNSFGQTHKGIPI